MQVVGPGTPAAKAGLKPDDVLKTVDGQPISDASSLEDALKRTRPDQSVKFVAVRKGKPLTSRPRSPPAVGSCPAGRQGTAVDALDLATARRPRIVAEEAKAGDASPAKRCARAAPRSTGTQGGPAAVGQLAAVGVGPVAGHVPTCRPELGLEITKTYRLAKVPGESALDADYPAYHLEFESDRNLGSKAHRVAYRLDGPNGLPNEGAWYASKVSRTGAARGSATSSSRPAASRSWSTPRPSPPAATCSTGPRRPARC